MCGKNCGRAWVIGSNKVYRSKTGKEETSGNRKSYEFRVDRFLEVIEQDNQPR